jgi:hypothetical protein
MAMLTETCPACDAVATPGCDTCEAWMDEHGLRWVEAPDALYGRVVARTDSGHPARIEWIAPADLAVCYPNHHCRPETCGGASYDPCADAL